MSIITVSVDSGGKPYRKRMDPESYDINSWSPYEKVLQTLFHDEARIGIKEFNPRKLSV
jgi:hypothetical protein